MSLVCIECLVFRQVTKPLASLVEGKNRGAEAVCVTGPLCKYTASLQKRPLQCFCAGSTQELDALHSQAELQGI